MAEEKEKKNEMKNKIKQENKENKPSLWQRMKKPLAAGLLSASLLVTPMKRAESVELSKVAAPPEWASEVIEKDPDLRKGWKLLMKAHKHFAGKERTSDLMAAKCYEAAVKSFKEAYEKTGKLEARYLWLHSLYLSAVVIPSFEETEKLFKEILEKLEERLREQPNDFDANDQKLMIYYGTTIMYYKAYALDEYYLKKGLINLLKLDFYREKAIEYAKKFKEDYKKTKEKWNEFDMFIFPDITKDKEIVKYALEGYRTEYDNYDKEISKILNNLLKE